MKKVALRYLAAKYFYSSQFLSILINFSLKILALLSNFVPIFVMFWNNFGQIWSNSVNFELSERHFDQLTICQTSQSRKSNSILEILWRERKSVLFRFRTLGSKIRIRHSKINHVPKSAVYQNVINKIKIWTKIDFLGLQKPRLGCQGKSFPIHFRGVFFWLPRWPIQWAHYCV